MPGRQDTKYHSLTPAKTGDYSKGRHCFLPKNIVPTDTLLKLCEVMKAVVEGKQTPRTKDWYIYNR